MATTLLVSHACIGLDLRFEGSQSTEIQVHEFHSETLSKPMEINIREAVTCKMKIKSVRWQ